MLMVMMATRVRSQNVRRNVEFRCRLGQFQRVEEGRAGLQHAGVLRPALRGVCVKCARVVDVVENRVDRVQTERQIRFYIAPPVRLYASKST